MSILLPAIAIVLAGVAGCIATNLFAYWIAGIPLWAIAKQPGKHLWSVVFAIPLPWLIGLSGATGIFIAFVWLLAAPTVASKVYFGPKDAPWMRLFAFHSGYAIAAILVYALVMRFA